MRLPFRDNAAIPCQYSVGEFVEKQLLYETLCESVYMNCRYSLYFCISLIGASSNKNGRSETGKRKSRIVKYRGILPTFNKGICLTCSYFIYQVDLRNPVLIVANVLLYAVPIVSVTEYLKFCKIYSVNVLWRT